MSTNLIVFAKVEAKPDCIELVKSQLLGLIPSTVQESGCIQYHLHQDNDNLAVFMFHEVWKSKSDLQQHLNSEHFKACMIAIENATLSVAINEMTQL